MTTPLSLRSAVARALELASAGQREILGIVGAPGAGKSTLAEQLVDELGPERAVLVPMDGFHLADVVLAQRGLKQVKGAIETFDDAGYAFLLNRIRNQRPQEIVYAPFFDRHLEEPIAGAIPVRPEVPLVITEGNYILSDEGWWPAARSVLTETWYLETPEETRQHRLIARHVAHGKTQSEARKWTLGSDEQNAERIRTTAKKADRIVRLENDPIKSRSQL